LAATFSANRTYTPISIQPTTQPPIKVWRRCSRAASSWTWSLPEHAKIAEDAGACAVMALERVPADIRADGGVARMSDPELIIKIKESVSIPVMAKCRIGHFVEAQILEALKIDYIDESEVLTPADEEHHIYKHDFTVPFVCGCRNLGEALRRIGEGAAMMRTKGEAGTGDVVEAVRHARTVLGEIRRIQNMPVEELMAYAKNIGAPLNWSRKPPNWAACRWSTLLRAALPPPPMPP
jgi:pyridoxal 5'-phosphate synthase subunit Pdx1